MANKRITDVDFIDSLESNESFFVNRNNSIKQIGKSDIVFGVSNGGTGATDAAAARANLGAAAIDHTHTSESLNITPESIGAAPTNHTHTSESLNITPESIGAAPTNHTHTDYLPKTGGTITGTTTFSGNILIGSAMYGDELPTDGWTVGRLFFRKV